MIYTVFEENSWELMRIDSTFNFNRGAKSGRRNQIIILIHREMCMDQVFRTEVL